VKLGEGAGGGGGEAEEEVEVAAAEGGGLGERTGEGHGFQVAAGPGAKERLELAADAVGSGVVGGGAVAVDQRAEVEVFGGQEEQESRARE
jgi:hypothetical protein